MSLTALLERADLGSLPRDAAGPLVQFLAASGDPRLQVLAAGHARDGQTLSDLAFGGDAAAAVAVLLNRHTPPHLVYAIARARRPGWAYACLSPVLTDEQSVEVLALGRGPVRAGRVLPSAHDVRDRPLLARELARLGPYAALAVLAASATGRAAQEVREVTASRMRGHYPKQSELLRHRLMPESTGWLVVAAAAAGLDASDRPKGGPGASPELLWWCAPDTIPAGAVPTALERIGAHVMPHVRGDHLYSVLDSPLGATHVATLLGNPHVSTAQVAEWVRGGFIAPLAVPTLLRRGDVPADLVAELLASAVSDPLGALTRARPQAQQPLEAALGSAGSLVPPEVVGLLAEHPDVRVARAGLTDARCSVGAAMQADPGFAFRHFHDPDALLAELAGQLDAQGWAGLWVLENGFSGPLADLVTVARRLL